MTVALVKSPSLFAEKLDGQEGGSEKEIREHKNKWEPGLEEEHLHLVHS